MEREERIKVLKNKLLPALESMFWKGDKNHPEKIEFIDALTYFISLAERMKVENLTKVLDDEHWRIINKHLSQAILDYLLGGEK